MNLVPFRTDKDGDWVALKDVQKLAQGIAAAEFMLDRYKEFVAAFDAYRKAPISGWEKVVEMRKALES